MCRRSIFHSSSDSFTFRASDGVADSNIGTATIAVGRNFRPPVVIDGIVRTQEDTAIDIMPGAGEPDGIEGVDSNGLDTLSYEILVAPAHGVLSGSAEQRSYMPNADFHGSDRLVCRVSDGVFDSETAEVLIAVDPVDDLPAAINEGDGLGDACEPDDDNDRLPDTWELAHGRDAFSAANAARDDDGDGLSEWEAYRFGTDPTRRDTNGNGVDDGTERAAAGLQGVLPLLLDCPQRPSSPLPIVSTTWSLTSTGWPDFEEKLVFSVG